VGKESFLLLPLLLERVGVRLSEDFVRKSKKDLQRLEAHEFAQRNHVLIRVP
jgi:hypothetical protein